MSQISGDFETRSDVDLKTHGSYRYFESPNARVLLGSFNVRGEMLRWRFGEPCPPKLRQAIEDGDMFSAHNASFEYLCFLWLAEHCGWPRPNDDQFRCTAATAAALGLPRGLGDLGEAMDLSVQKDKEGKRLIQKFSIPRKPTHEEQAKHYALIGLGVSADLAQEVLNERGVLTPRQVINGVFWNEPEDEPEEFGHFHDYCDDDVHTEDAADERMIPLSDAEQQVYLLSEKINRRGIRIDTASARAAIRLAAKAKAYLDAEMREITDGAVPATTNVAKLVAWVESQGVAINSAAKAEITDLLATADLPERVRKALEIRQEAAKSSVSKLQAMLDRASADGRVRGTFLYHGAGTGRWTNMGVNFANMPRPRRCYEDAHPRTDVLFRAFRTEDPAVLQHLYGPELGRPLHLVSDAIRGFVWAAPGHDLVQADYSGIEGAVIAWLAREEWKLAELAAIIADPSRPDMYRQTAARIMNLSTDIITKKHPLRQSVGKTSELALGFEGGVRAFYTMSLNYGVDLDHLYGPVWEATSAERREKALKRYANVVKRKQSAADVLSREAWLACEIVKVGWREANGAIKQLWSDQAQAVRSAVASPGTITEAGRCKFLVSRGFLWNMLPSGRCLAYAKPKLHSQVWAEILCDDGTWSDAEVTDREEAEKLELAGKARIQGDTSPSVTFAGLAQGGKKLIRQPLYGGLISQNATQATARDILVNGMFKAEAAGYPVVAHVYDEIISEVKRGYGSVAEFERIICELPEWADGLPLTAGGWRGKRYRKE